MKEFRDDGDDEDGFVAQTVSPCGRHVAILHASERLSVWKLFEKRKVNLSEDAFDGGQTRADLQGESNATSEDALRVKLERIDARLVEKNMR